MFTQNDYTLSEKKTNQIYDLISLEVRLSSRTIAETTELDEMYDTTIFQYANVVNVNQT